jgi:hypothetical protein
VVLIHLPGGRTAEQDCDGLVPTMARLPAHLRGAQEINGRPRKTLGWKTPAERLRQLLSA